MITYRILKLYPIYPRVILEGDPLQTSGYLQCLVCRTHCTILAQHYGRNFKMGQGCEAGGSIKKQGAKRLHSLVS